ncbi:MAG: hypothetical protein OHK0046_47080 [Anaerolineae bacterium]
MLKKLRFPLLVMTVCIIALFIVVLPAQLQDIDPRNYYPEGCESGQEDNLWRHAPEAETFMLTRLNQWRLAARVQPLQRNQRLDTVAERQAMYIAPNAPFSDPAYVEEGSFSIWHEDAIGSGVLDRLERNGWPLYDDGRVIGGEIAAYWPTVSASINFWQDSPIHNLTATLPGYREVGLRVLCWRGWLLSYVVFASQPDMLTATYDPYTNLLYLGDESRSYAGVNPGFRPDYLQIRDYFGNRLHNDEWLLWNRFIQLPEDSPDDIIITATDGVTTISIPVNIMINRTFPSQPTPTPSPTLTPVPTRYFEPVEVLPTMTPSATPDPANGSHFDVMIYYNEDYFTIVNESGEDANWEVMAIEAAEFPPFQRNIAYFAQFFVNSGGHLDEFPKDSCLQGFSLERFANGPGPRPESCERLVAWRSALQPGERFWLRDHFSIIYNLEPIATCPGLVIRSDSLVCGFDLP